MAILSSVSATPLASSQSPAAAAGADDLKARMGSIVAKTAQRIAADSKTRNAGLTRDIKLLESGYWYPNDYFFALKAANQTARLAFFLKNGSFYHGFPNTKKTGLEYIPFDNATGKLPCAYRLSEMGVRASDAIKAFQENLVLADCAQFCQVSQYQALLEVLGEARFNKLFSSVSKDRMIIGGYGMAGNPLLVFLKLYSAKEKKDSRVLEVSQRVAFENFPYYTVKHLNGEATAFNAICIDATPAAPKFVSLGTPPEGLTEDAMNSLLVKEYNETPVDFSIFSPELEKKIKAKFHPQILPASQQFADHTITVLDLKKAGKGFNPQQTIEFDMATVSLALQTPLERLSIDFLKEQKGW